MDSGTLEKPAGVAHKTLRTYEDLPGPSRVPLLANLLQIEVTRMHQQLEHWAAAYGPIYRLKLGKRRAVVVAEHELVSTILRDRPDGFRRTSKLEQVWGEMGLLNGVFAANGEAWRRQRRMVMAAFDPAHVKAYFPALTRVAQRLAGRWRAAAETGESIDLTA